MQKIVDARVPEKLLENLRKGRHSHKFVNLLSAQIVFNLCLHEDFARLVFTAEDRENLLTLMLVIVKQPALPQVSAILLEILLGESNRQ